MAIKDFESEEGHRLGEGLEGDLSTPPQSGNTNEGRIGRIAGAALLVGFAVFVLNAMAIVGFMMWQWVMNR